MWHVVQYVGSLPPNMRPVYGGYRATDILPQTLRVLGNVARHVEIEAADVIRLLCVRTIRKGENGVRVRNLRDRARIRSESGNWRRT